MPRLRVTALMLTLLLSGCDQSGSDASASYPSQPDQSLPDSSSFAAHLGLSAYTQMSLAAQAAQELDSKLAAFLHSPTPASLETTREAWRTAYNAWLETLIYSYLPLNDPPDWEGKGIGYQQTIRLLDSWPVEGGYIDYVAGYPFSGIVNDLALELTEANLISQHGFSDPTYASLGYHAFEFMLWGADGQRPVRDFMPQENTAPVIIGNENDTPAPETPAAHHTDVKLPADTVQNHNRRRQYVQLVSEQLQKHLHRLQRRWEPSNGYYAGLLQRSEPEQILRASLSATQKLLSEELLGKRLALKSSEFSNTSWADVHAIVQGIRKLYLPAGNGTAGGLNSVLRNRDLPLSAEWDKQLGLVEASLVAWRESGDNEESRLRCHERLIELLSLLQKTAVALQADLPAPQ